MSKILKLTILSGSFAILGWFTAIVLNPDGLEFILFIMSILFSISFICFLGVWIYNLIVKKLNRQPISSYKSFIVMDAVLCAITILYAIYDIKTDIGWFAGLIGTLLLVYVTPVMVILGVITFVLSIKSKNNK